MVASDEVAPLVRGFDDNSIASTQLLVDGTPRRIRLLRTSTAGRPTRRYGQHTLREAW